MQNDNPFPSRPCIRIPSWIVYENPKDYPGEFVVRQFFMSPNIVEPGDVTGRGKTFFEAKNQGVPAWATRIEPDPQDDPCIRAVYL